MTGCRTSLGQSSWGRNECLKVSVAEPVRPRRERPRGRGGRGQAMPNHQK
jgi:hypothetical protein